MNGNSRGESASFALGAKERGWAALYMQHRIRKAMAENQATWLSEIIEADYLEDEPS